jgi:hypothetical protein
VDKLRWPGTAKCDRCQQATASPVYLVGETVCWECYDGGLQADADRACDEMRDREVDHD